jgi:hypothetical protein
MVPNLFVACSLITLCGQQTGEGRERTSPVSLSAKVIALSAGWQRHESQSHKIGWAGTF